MSEMEARKKTLKIEIEYFELSEAREILGQVRVNSYNIMQTLKAGNAKGIVTGHCLDFEKEIPELNLEPKEPDRIEEINGRIHYIYKSKL